MSNKCEECPSKEHCLLYQVGPEALILDDKIEKPSDELVTWAIENDLTLEELSQMNIS